MYISKNLKFLIKKTCVYHSELAEIVGVKQNTISNWVHEVSKPDFDKIDIIANYFDIPPQDFIYKDLSADNEMTIHIRATKNSNPNVQIGSAVNESAINYTMNGNGKPHTEEVSILKERVSFLEGQVHLLRELLGK